MSISLLPKIMYNFAIRNEDPKPLVIPDLLLRMKLKLSETEKRTILFDYTILDGETPEIVSHKVYDTVDYHWIIMYINECFDYITDWPIKDDLVYNLAIQKYGEDKVDDIHHYEDERGNIVDEYYYDWKNSSNIIPKGTLAQEPIWKQYYKDGNNAPVVLRTLQATPITNYEFELVANDRKRSIKLIRKEFIIKFYKSYVGAMNSL